MPPHYLRVDRAQWQRMCRGDCPRGVQQRSGGAQTSMNGVNPSEITRRPMPRVLDSAGLFYRLSVCPVDLPLLRDHTEDVCLYGPPRCNGLRRSHAQTSYNHLERLHSGSCPAFVAWQVRNCKTSIELSVILTTGGSHEFLRVLCFRCQLRESVSAHLRRGLQ
jgi:hypothetical protein